MRYGFLGLGIMGSRMAARLLRAGFDVTVWNRDAGKCLPLVELGARQCASPKEVAASVDIVFAMVADPQASLDLCFGADGVLAGIGPGSGYVDMSTVDPATSRRIAEAVAAKGARFLEAPVSGTKQPAADGTLVILAAGDRDLYDRSLPAFERMGRLSLHLGDVVGQGAKMKLVVNLVLGTMMEILGESLALGEKCGLAGDQILQVLAEGAMANPMFRVKGPMILTGDTTTSFPLKHMEKDLRLTLQLSRELEQDLPVAAAVHAVFGKALAEGYGDRDIAAVVRSL
ncbi:MAG: NAD(P)-dependent oxidoreductase [Desulfobulbus sp.]|jgi:3-hydroxyisobutyrate dehydrogenase-like beta-hydroxyacid dehydrogenase|uniref:NAD(P)-dependent oxidoreductase n=1 Tax=Desulfobulbus sp. TaxID=895 RepID=UPI00284CBECD|nr:NAD(P)-dependent oxidoreductase [Desulfobulbus sp.]MDR2550135.1 NAD(P)-dependent oxidoreductase [Desulfobulbus sp.]